MYCNKCGKKIKKNGVCDCNGDASTPIKPKKKSNIGFITPADTIEPVVSIKVIINGINELQISNPLIIDSTLLNNVFSEEEYAHELQVYVGDLV